jgi:hypothetical protein
MSRFWIMRAAKMASNAGHQFYGCPQCLRKRKCFFFGVTGEWVEEWVEGQFEWVEWVEGQFSHCNITQVEKMT